MRKYLLPALVIAGIAVLILYLNQGDDESTGQDPITAFVKEGGFDVYVQATAEIRAKNSVKIRGPQRMRDAGIWQTTISKILPEGTTVKKGDWVASLDKSGITGKFDETSSEIEKIETQLEQAKIDTAIELGNMRDQLSDLEFDVREKELLVEQSQFEAQMIIQQAQLSLERIRRDFQQLQNNYQLKQKQSRAKIAEINASYRQQKNKMAIYQQISDEFDVKAPEDGMLIYISRWGGEKLAEGGQVSAWDPQVGELPDLSSMISITYVNEVDISKVKIGQEVEIGADAFPDKTFDGVVTKVANVGQQLRNHDAKVFEVVVELQTSDSTLRPAMTSSNKILVRKYDNVIAVPLEALSQDSLAYVILKKGNKNVKQEIVLGEANEDFIVAELGLSAGDEIYLQYTGDLEALDWNYLGEADKKQAMQDKQNRDQAFDLLVSERRKNTKKFDGRTSEGSPNVIIIR